jgi:hypothetical protein
MIGFGAASAACSAGNHALELPDADSRPEARDAGRDGSRFDARTDLDAESNDAVEKDAREKRMLPKRT